MSETLTQKRRFTDGQLVLAVALSVIILDQVIKIWVKTHFYLYEEYSIASWFKIEFIENNGMAFGWHIGSKLILTLFRILLAGFMIYALYKLRDVVLKRGFVICVALVLAGALGNLIDCMFYGMIFSESTPDQIAVLFPAGGGYGSFMHGKVVDMLYFPIFGFDWPGWVPFIGGKHFEFFSPVFNFADAAISVGIICVIFFYSKSLNFAYDTLAARMKAKKEQKDKKQK